MNGEPAPGFHYPAAIACLPNGVAGGASLSTAITEPVLVVCDASNRLYILTLEGKLKRTIGGPGAGACQFALPLGLCVSPLADCVFVADTQNHRIQKIRLYDGQLLAFAGRLGAGHSDLRQPHSIAYCNGCLYVTDSWNHRVCVYSSTTTQSGQFRCATDYSEEVDQLECLRTFGGKGREKGRFQYPRGIVVWNRVPDGEREATDATIEVIVADARNHRVQCLSASGAYLRGVGGGVSQTSAGRVLGTTHFEFPSSLALSPDNRFLFVADQRAVLVLDMEQLIGVCVVAMPQPSRMLSARPSALCPFALSAYAPQPRRSTPLTLYLSEYDEHAISEVTLSRDDLRGDATPCVPGSAPNRSPRVGLAGSAPERCLAIRPLAWGR